LLLLIGNTTSLQLPLKVFEYIGARRPILCVRNGEQDLAANLLGPLSRGIVVASDAGAIARGIRQAYDLWAKGELENTFSLEDRDEFTWARSGTLLNAMLRRIAEL
jgi:hypothetical protein